MDINKLKGTMVDGSPIPGISPNLLSEFDHYLVIDASGSMKEASAKSAYASRWAEVQVISKKFSNFLNTGNSGSPIDGDGYTLITFNDKTTITDNVQGEAAIDGVFAAITPNYGTNFGGMINDINKLYVAKKKQAFIWIYTDGAPSGMSGVADALKAVASMTQNMSKDADLAIAVIQVGKDPEATAFLQTLDDELQTKYGAKFDAVCCIPSTITTDLSFEQIAYMALNG